MNKAMNPAEMLRIQYLLTDKEEPKPEIEQKSESSKIGRKSLLTEQQFEKFISIVEEFETSNGIKMTWKHAAKVIQDILNRQSKVPRTSAARYLKLAEMKANIATS